MKKNFHWLVFALVTIAFWRTSDNLLFEHKSIRFSVGYQETALSDAERDGWEIESRTTFSDFRVCSLHLKRCKLYHLFD